MLPMHLSKGLDMLLELLLLARSHDLEGPCASCTSAAAAAAANWVQLHAETTVVPLHDRLAGDAA